MLCEWELERQDDNAGRTIQMGMTLQPLIATLDGRFFARGYSPPFDHYLVINQGTEPAGHVGYNNASVFHYQEKGLSRSRNRALQKASADICLISDDDVTYFERAKDIILQSFADNPLADIITFQSCVPSGALRKTYPAKQTWHTQRSLMRVISWEIAFRKKSILHANLAFDERFGLGAMFATGEENIFLLDGLRHGLKILYVPMPIVMHPEQSSGANFDEAGLIVAKGAMFYRMFSYKAYFIALLFAVKKHRLSRFGLLRFYQLMAHGMRQYKTHE